jgi:glyoxylase-like metal-dependent hydrolase (beta-lactamase superfamily II)
VLIAGFPAGPWATNCYVVAPGSGAECVIIDPGMDATPGVSRLLAEHRLKPVAVLVTHGHLDHMFSVLPLCGAHDVPAYVHPDDRELLSDPAKGLGEALGRQLLGGLSFAEPDDVRELADGAVVELAGLELTVSHAPGHTPGSVTFGLPGAADGSPPRLFSGDLLFAGSIGRTDLPGGDHAAILRSLATVCLPLADETLVHAGHGPDTTIGRERAGNPFLAQARAAHHPVGPRQGVDTGRNTGQR